MAKRGDWKGDREVRGLKVRELAAALLLAGMLARPGAESADEKEMVKYAVRMADRLLKELKK